VPHATFAAHSDVLPSHLAFDIHAAGMVDYDLFESIYNPGKMLLLSGWKTAEDSAHWTPKMFADAAKLRHRRARNVRDYGMFERREAAQYFPDAKCPMGSAGGIVRSKADK